MTDPPHDQTVQVTGVDSAQGFGGVRLWKSAAFDWAVEGFERAMSRLQEVRRLSTQTSDRETLTRETFIALFDGLNWGASLIEHLLRRQRRQLPDMLHGLRFVRNRVHHNWAEAIEYRYERREKDIGGGLAIEWSDRPGFYWVERAALPDPDRPDPEGEAAYPEYLAGRPVEKIFEVISMELQEAKKALQDADEPRT